MTTSIGYQVPVPSHLTAVPLLIGSAISSWRFHALRCIRISILPWLHHLDICSLSNQILCTKSWLCHPPRHVIYCFVLCRKYLLDCFVQRKLDTQGTTSASCPIFTEDPFVFLSSSQGLYCTLLWSFAACTNEPLLQVDEPALREGLPLKQERWSSYLEWAVKSFRLATAVAQSQTQIVTHLCYSEFADILEVTHTLFSSLSRNKI